MGEETVIQSGSVGTPAFICWMMGQVRSMSPYAHGCPCDRRHPSVLVCLRVCHGSVDDLILGRTSSKEGAAQLVSPQRQ